MKRDDAEGDDAGAEAAAAAALASGWNAGWPLMLFLRAGECEDGDPSRDTDMRRMPKRGDWFDGAAADKGDGASVTVDAPPTDSDSVEACTGPRELLVGEAGRLRGAATAGTAAVASVEEALV